MIFEADEEITNYNTNVLHWLKKLVLIKWRQMQSTCYSDKDQVSNQQLQLHELYGPVLVDPEEHMS
jgi:hypothetical protein